MSTINNIISQIGKTGLAPANRYRLIIPGIDDYLNFYCESVTLPGRNINTNEYSTTGELKKIPYGYTDEDVNITLLLDREYKNRDYFTTWMEKIIDTKNFITKYKSEYVQQVTIQQLDVKNNPTYTVELVNAFPVNVGSVELSSASENTISRCNITLTFDKFIIKN